MTELFSSRVKNPPCPLNAPMVTTYSLAAFWRREFVAFAPRSPLNATVSRDRRGLAKLSEIVRADWQRDGTALNRIEWQIGSSNEVRGGRSIRTEKVVSGSVETGCV